VELLPSLHTAVLPPVFSYTAEERGLEACDVLRLAFLSNFDWWPNREALDWFLQEVWSGVEAPAELHLFGPGIGSVPQSHANVVVHGPVDDVRDAFRGCDLAIAPIRRGAGVKIKVAEALYNGVPVLTTACGARGIGDVRGLQILDSPEEWQAFLNGGTAREFASAPVPAASREQFSLASVRPSMEQFFARVFDGVSR
jgi:glycosyltransferase involved in cell wall biosynthesis